MRKLDIVKNLQSSTDLNRKEASEFFETFLNQLKKNIKNKNQKITRFGTFYKHITKSRVGRNPKTKVEYKIQTMEKIKFKAASSVKIIKLSKNFEIIYNVHHEN